MATAKSVNKKVKKMVEVETNEREIVLNLSLEEALAIQALTGSIAHCGEFRKHTNEIYHALRSQIKGNIFCDIVPTINKIDEDTFLKVVKQAKQN